MFLKFSVFVACKYLTQSSTGIGSSTYWMAN